MDKPKILNLIIKQKYFDDIVNGKQTKEVRQVRPSNEKKLVQLNEDGDYIADMDDNILPVEYDYLRLYVGYAPDRDSMLVEIKDSYTEKETFLWTKEDGSPMLWRADDNGKILYFKTGEDGQYLRDENGELIPADENDDPDYTDPKRDEESGNGVPWYMPITYEWNGLTTFAMNVIYELGEIIELKHKERKKKRNDD